MMKTRMLRRNNWSSFQKELPIKYHPEELCAKVKIINKKPNFGNRNIWNLPDLCQKTVESSHKSAKANVRFVATRKIGT